MPGTNHRTVSILNALLYGAVALVGGLAIGAGANAQQNIKISIISGNAPANTPIGAAIDGFSPAVDKVLAKTGKFKVQWVHGFSGTVVKTRGELEGMEAGLGDMGIVPAVFYADKLPMYQLTYATPFTSKDIDVMVEGFDRLLQKFPAFTKELEKYNQIPLKVGAAMENYALWTKKEIKALNELRGVKIGMGGPNIPWLRPTGVVGVLTALDTMYNSLQSGVFDGIVMWQQVAGTFKFCELAPYHLDPSMGGVMMQIMTVNKDSWARYPAEVKSAITESMKAWSDENNRRITEGTKAGADLCVKQYKQKTTVMAPAEVKAWADDLPSLGLDWARARDKAGQDGTKILQEWMGFMREKKQIVVRDWDKK